MTPGRIVVLDASGPRARVGALDGPALRLDATEEGTAGGPAEALPALLRRALGVLPAPDAVAVVCGPGSFTGLRAALALAQGFADGRGIPAVAVSVPEAVAAAATGPRPVWCAQSARGTLLYLTQAGAAPIAIEAAALPDPAAPVAIGGDAAPLAAATLAARGHDVLLSDARRPEPAVVAAIARERIAGLRPPLPFAPIYAEPLRARPQAHGRPPPA